MEKKLVPSQFHNQTLPNGKPYVIAEVGVHFFFGGDVQKTFEITDVVGSRPFCHELDLFQYWQDVNVLPVALIEQK